MAFTKKQLDSALGLKTYDAKDETVIEHRSHPPGHAVLNKLYFRNNPNYYQHKKSTRAAKKKIIISDPFLNTCAMGRFELEFFEALFEHYEVHLYQGDDYPIKDSKPIPNVNQFFLQRHLLKPGYKDAVLRSLSQQSGIKASDYEILDYEKFCNVITEAHKYENEYIGTYPYCEQSPRVQLNLKNINLNVREEISDLLRGVDTKRVTAVTLFKPTRAEVEFIRHQCPNLKIIKISGADPEWLHENAYYLHDFDIELTDLKISDGTVNLPETLNITSLSISPPYAFTSLTIRQKADTLKKLDIGCYKIVNLDISSFRNLDSLSLKSVHDVDITELLPKIPIKSLSLEYAKTFSLDLSPYPMLENLNLLSCYGNLKLNSELPNLKKLEIKDMQVSEINLSSQKLETVFLSKIRDLERVTFNNLPQKLTMDSCTELTSIQYKNSGNLEELDTDFCPNLQLSPDLIAKQLPETEIRQHSPGEYGNKYESPDDPLYGSDKEQITIEKSSENQILSRYVRLKEAEITKFSGNHINFYGCSQLRTTKIDIKDKVKGPITIDLTGCENLISLNIDCSCEIKLIGVSNCKKLMKTDIRATKFPEQLLEHKYCRNSFTLAADKPELQAPASSPINLDLHFENEQSPVSRLMLGDGNLHIDGNVAAKTTHYKATQNSLRAVLSAQIPLDKDEYRFEIFDEVALEDNQVVYRSNNKNLLKSKQQAILFTDKQAQIQELIAEKNQRPNYILGNFSGELKPGKVYPLPSLHALSEDDLSKIYSDNPHVDIFYNEEHRQYYCKLSSKAISGKVDLYYLTKQHPEYDKKADPTYLYPQKNNADLLPAELIKRIMAEASNPKSKLNFLVEPNTSHFEKIQALIKYCSVDNDKAVGSLTTKYDMETLMALCTGPNGACRHRAFKFMVLARFLGVPAHIITNEMHAYCEIPYSTSNKKETQWQRIDMGGTDLVDVTDKKLRENPFAKFESSKPSTKPTITVNPPSNIKAYYQHFKNISDKALLHTSGPVLKKMTDRPVLELKSRQDPWLVSQQIRTDLMLIDDKFNVDKDYFYIDHPDDLRTFYSGYQLKDGKRVEVPGPLADILLNPRAVFVINWANFTPGQMATYQSLLDKDRPRLFGKDVHCHVIGLIKPNTMTSDDFTSRNKRYVLADDFLLDFPKKDNPVKAKEIDLYHQHDVEEKLFGQVTLDGKQANFIPGPVLEAINNLQSLTILNMPNDAETQRYLKYINHERKFFYNGIYYTVPDNVTIQQNTKPHVLDATDNTITITSNYTIVSPLNHPIIFLNSQNWHECFEHFIVNNEQRDAFRNEGNGLITRHRRFYLTESIKKSDWEFIVVKIKEVQKKHHETHGEKLNFEFVLAPGVTIKDVATNNNAAYIPQNTTLDKLNSPITFCNDTDFVTQEIAQREQDPLIIDVSPFTTFNELIADITHNSVPSGYEFSYHEQAALMALNKRTVILNGELSPDLYQLLLPYFTPGATVELNGKPVTLSGKLMAVMPDTAQKNYAQLLPTETCQVDWPEYQRAFSNDDKLIQKIKQFYQLANLFPYQSVGRPAKPHLSGKRIDNMLSELKQEQWEHRNNPIKAVFHYDYPKSSADYAYLNATAKWIFSKETLPTVNEKKLADLRKKYPINTPQDLDEHVWLFLNCLNGSALCKLIGNEMNQLMDSIVRSNSQAIPSLKQLIRDKLYLKIYPLIEKLDKNTLNVESQETKNLKLEKTLASFLTHTTRRILFLKGDPGVGKTHSARSLKENPNINFHDGFNAITAWLEDNQGEQQKLLLLDEANTQQSGVLDFLKAIKRIKSDGKNQDFHYRGRLYQITAKHKVITTGNFEDTPNRYYHALLQNYAATFYLPKPNDALLVARVLRPKLSKIGLTPELNALCNQFLLHAYHLLPTFQSFVELSQRDLENLSWRFVNLLKGDYSKEAVTQALIQAATCELSGMIVDADKREKFVAALNQALGIPLKPQTHTAPRKVNDIFVTAEKQYIVTAIQQDLLLAQRAENLPQQYYKPGLLIQGDSAVGKSRIVEEALQQEGFKYIEIDKLDTLTPETASKSYIVLNAGPPEIHAKLEHAAHLGLKIIVNEANLDETLNPLLNKLLTGRDSKENLINRRAMFFLTQNPSYFPDRIPQESPIYNRLHVMNMDSYSKTELIDLATANGVADPESYVEGYLQSNAETPNVINFRKFFEEMHAKVELVSRIEKESKQENTDLLVAHMIENVATRFENKETKPIKLEDTNEFRPFKEALNNYLKESTASPFSHSRDASLKLLMQPSELKPNINFKQYQLLIYLFLSAIPEKSHLHSDILLALSETLDIALNPMFLDFSELNEQINSKMNDLSNSISKDNLEKIIQLIKYTNKIETSAGYKLRYFPLLKDINKMKESENSIKEAFNHVVRLLQGQSLDERHVALDPQIGNILATNIKESKKEVASDYQLLKNSGF